MPESADGRAAGLWALPRGSEWRECGRARVGDSGTFYRRAYEYRGADAGGSPHECGCRPPPAAAGPLSPVQAHGLAGSAADGRCGRHGFEARDGHCGLAGGADALVGRRVRGRLYCPGQADAASPGRTGRVGFGRLDR